MCNRQDKKSRKNDKNSNDNVGILLGKRRELGKIIKKPTDDLNVCVGTCRMRQWAPKRVKKCIKKCKKQQKRQ